MIFTVANRAELETALQRVGDGDRIELLGREYAGASLRDRSFERPVTITSADPANPAVLRDQLEILRVSGIDVTGIHLAPDGKALDLLDVVLVSRSSDITLRGNTITGHIPDAGEGLPANADIDSARKAKDLIEGQPFARGIRIVDSNAVRIEDNTLSRLRKGIILDTVEGASVTGNHLKDLREDGINLADAVSVTIAGNLMESFYPLHNYDNIAFADHGDFIQWWAGDGGLGIRDLVIRDNALLQGSGSWTQGIFGRGGGVAPDGRSAVFSGIRIENNLINISHPNGIFVGDATDVQIAGNTLLPAPMDLTLPAITSGIPGIQVRTSARLLPDGSHDISRGGALPREVSVRENLLVGGRPFQSYQIDTALHAELGISASGNTVLSKAQAHPAFWGNAFPHLLDRPVAGLGDLVSAGIPGGGVDIAAWPDRLRTLFTDLADSGMNRSSHHGTRGIRAEGTDASEEITGTAVGDVLRGGKGSDCIATGGGADLVAFHRSDLAAGDLDIITDLDFPGGDWISFSGGFGRGFFDDGADPDNSLTTYGSGDSAVVHDFEDLRELMALDAVSALWSDGGTVDLGVDLNGDAVPDWTLRLDGLQGTPERRSALPNNDHARADHLPVETANGVLIFDAPDHMDLMMSETGIERLAHHILVPQDDLPIGF